MQRLSTIGTSLLITLFLRAATSCAAEPIKIELVRVLDRSGNSSVGEFEKEDEKTISLRDLDSGKIDDFEKASVAKIEHPLGESDAAKYIGLPKLMAWKIAQLPAKKPVVGKIAKVTPTVVYLNLGEASGIAPEQELTVYRNAEDVIDPDTKQVLAHERQKLAKLQVVEVAKAYSKARMLGELETPLVIGDEVELAVQKLLVAVLPIDNETGEFDGTALTEQLITALSNKGIPVVERALLDKVLAEQLVQHTVLFDEKAAQHIGKLLGATAVLTGKIVSPGEAHVRLIEVSSGMILSAASQKLANARPTPAHVTAPRHSEAPTRPARGSGAVTTSKILPGFVYSRGEAIIGKEGLEIKPGGVIRTKLSDYIKHDFVFDVVYTFPKTTPLQPNEQTIHVGIGDESLEDGHPKKCVALVIRPITFDADGRITILKTGEGARESAFGSLRKLGPHKIQIEKSGPALTFRIDVDNDGDSVDDMEMTIPDVTQFAPFLNDKNSYLYVGGGAFFTKGRISVGRISAVESASSATLKDANMLSLSRGKPWPAFLDAGDNTLIAKNGLEIRPQTYVSTKRADFTEKDFTFEAELTFPASTDRQPLDQIAFVGIGEPNQGQSPDPSVYMSIRPPDVNDGYCDIGMSDSAHHKAGNGKRVTNLRGRGPHIVRIEKRGKEVTFGIDIDADGKTDEDVELTIPDIAERAPFLHKKNSHLFFGGGAIFTKVRLTVNN